MPWQPVIDGDVVPARPIDRIAAGAGVGHRPHGRLDHRRVELLPGTRRRDRSNHSRDPGRSRCGATGFRWKRRWPPIAQRIPAPAPASCSRPSRAIWYCPHPRLRLADAHAKSIAATYMYEFAWRSPQFDGGSARAMELRSPSSSTRSARRLSSLAGSQPSAAAGRHDARRLDCLCAATGTPVGRGTTSPVAPRCASIRARRWWTTLEASERAVVGRRTIVRRE